MNWLKTWPIAIFLIFFLISSQGKAQDCSLVYDDKGAIPNVLKVNGEVKFLQSELQARAVAKKLLDAELNLKKVELLEKSLEFHSKYILDQSAVLLATEHRLKTEIEANKKLTEAFEESMNAPDPVRVFLVGAGVGAILTAATIFAILYVTD
jgi:hypothetical protein